MILELINVNHSYKNFNIKNVSFKIKKGELVGITGKNGSGKTSLLKIISGIIPNENVYIDGNKITKNNLCNISYMDSNSFFYELLTVNEMIDFVRYIHNNSYDSHINSWIKDIGLYTYKDELIKNLSLGNRQKLAFILALINKPKILLLDEPFNGIDEVSVKFIIAILKKITHEKRTVIITTHVRNILDQLCTRLIKLDNGSIVKDINN